MIITMINEIYSGGKIWKRRSKNLTSGEIICPRCGDPTKVRKFTDKHFNEPFLCKNCTKETKPKPKKLVTKPKRKKETFPENCPHKPFFNCKVARNCVGCYYHPVKKIALMPKTPDDPPKTARNHWFYGVKSHSKRALKLLDDIKHGRGLCKGGTRTYFKYARKEYE